jgi:RND family efflux transporter MFP subunit
MEDEPKAGSSSVFYLLLCAGLLTAGALFVVGLLPKIQRQKEAVEQSRELSLTRVHAVRPAPAPEGKPLTLSGELKPWKEASIVARVTGYVHRWHADLGQSVEAGQLLAELDTPEIQSEISRAKAQLALAEATRHLAEITAGRWKELLASKSAAQQEADEKDADLRFKNAALAAAQAEVHRLEEISGFAKITAPFAGILTARKIEVGQLVEIGGGRELFRLAQVDKLRVFVRVPQSVARSIQVGQSAELTLPEMPGKTFPASVIRTAGAIEPASRTLLTELEIKNQEGHLLAGSYAQVRIHGARENQPLTVPANALIFRSEGAQLALVDATQRVRLRAVVLGRDFGSSVQILEGITAQDRVIPNPPDSLTDGLAVEVVE